MDSELKVQDQRWRQKRVDSLLTQKNNLFKTETCQKLTPSAASFITVGHFYWLSIIKADTSKLQTLIASPSVMSSPQKHITKESNRLHSQYTLLTMV